jgi:hypothetical protein
VANVLGVVGVIAVLLFGAVLLGLLIGSLHATVEVLTWLGRLLAPPMERWIRRRFGDDVIREEAKRG